ncbi:MAG: hypothetical protein ACRD4S_17020 [Candidatus Acidiferrales bacterium]
MHIFTGIVIWILAAVILLGLGYALRGLIHREMVASREEVESYVIRLSSAISKEGLAVKDEVAKVLSELRAKL